MEEEKVSLKEHFEKILAEKDKALESALVSAAKAVEVAEKNAEKWRDNANEWRAAMNDKDRNFATKTDVENLKEWMDVSKGKGLGLSQGWAILIAVVGLCSLVVGIIFTVTRFI